MQGIAQSLAANFQDERLRSEMEPEKPRMAAHEETRREKSQDGGPGRNPNAREAKKTAIQERRPPGKPEKPSSKLDSHPGTQKRGHPRKKAAGIPKNGAGKEKTAPGKLRRPSDASAPARGRLKEMEAASLGFRDWFFDKRTFFS
jgi:hypothetical protein